MKKTDFKKAKKHIPKLILLVLVAIGVAATVWYIWGVEKHPSPSYEDTPAQTAKLPQEYCVPAGGICLTPPADWNNNGLDQTFIDLASPSKKTRIMYSHQTSNKVTPCNPGECVIVVYSIEDHALLPDTKLVRAVIQQTKHGANVPEILLISATDAEKYALAADETIDMGVQTGFTFSRVVAGRTYTQSLTAVGYEPGNYTKLEGAQKWFDTWEAQAAYNTIRKLKLAQ